MTTNGRAVWNGVGWGRVWQTSVWDGEREGRRALGLDPPAWQLFLGGGESRCVSRKGGCGVYVLWVYCTCLVTWSSTVPV